MANQMGMVFAKLDCKPRWRERLPELAIPALVVHGRRDPFFPVGNGEALAREIPGARLLVLERAATAIPDAAAGEVAAAQVQVAHDGVRLEPDGVGGRQLAARRSRRRSATECSISLGVVLRAPAARPASRPRPARAGRAVADAGS